ncbi:MAG TPA: hypothetical protein VIJ15_13595, partial [Dermatophilaceae bacterium]
GPGHTRQVRQAVTLSPDLTTSPTPAPTLGQHSDAVRGWLLADRCDHPLSTNHSAQEAHP